MLSAEKQIQKLTGSGIKKITGKGGGCIGKNYEVLLESGEKVFAKLYPEKFKRICQSEKESLEILRNKGAFRIPKIIGVLDSLIILEWIPDIGKKDSLFFAKAGEKLAETHRNHSSQYGFDNDNFIGLTPQKNTPRSADWIEFFSLRRLDFQIERLKKTGREEEKILLLYPPLRKKIPEILSGTEEEKPSLLHGDLWSGNLMADENNEPVLIDPAVYYGQREADLSLAVLFGGFGEEFFDSYFKHCPLPSGFEKRIKLYSLYHLLNHLNLFGGGYSSGCLQVMKELLSA